MLLTTGGFALMAIGVSVIALVSRNYSRQATRQTQNLTDQFLPGLMTLARLQDAARNLKNINFQFALAKDDAAMDARTRAFAADLDQVARHVAGLQHLLHDAPAQQLIVAFEADLQRYRASSERFQAELREGEFVKAMATLDQEIEPAQRKIETQLTALNEQYFQRAQAASTRTAALLQQSEGFGVLATFVLTGFTLLCLVLSFVATRIIIAQLEKREAERQAAHDHLEKRVEERTQELAYERDQLRSLLDSSPDAIYFKDRDSRFVLVSRSTVQNILTEVPGLRERLLGPDAAPNGPVDPEKLVGLSDADTYTPEHAEFTRAAEQKIMRTGEPEIGKVEKTLYLNGSSRWALTNKMPWRDKNGQVIGTFGVSKDITELKKAEERLEEVHRQLLETSRAAGMAEVATSVLHNVGNVLNSVNVSATLVSDTVRRSRADKLGKLSALLAEHQHDLATFLSSDSRGKMLQPYLGTLAEELAREKQSMIVELEHLRKNVDHIKEIVGMQQEYAKTSGVIEIVSIPDLVEDALRMNAGSLARHDIEVVRDYIDRPVIPLDKHKVLQILVNLIRNAKHACDEAALQDKRIIIRVTTPENSIAIAVIDNGVGIPPENLTRIFNHGFTTKSGGHGFGLHSGALSAKEMGGALLAQSEGPGRGATFTLTLPVNSSTPVHE